MTATEKHFPPYIDSENTDADTQGNAESWVTPNRALRYTGSISNGASLFVEHELNELNELNNKYYANIDYYFDCDDDHSDGHLHLQ